MRTIWTIGHSTHNIEDFLSLLRKNQIDTIVDVRTTPYSKFAPQFNRELLRHFLKEENIYYIPMGDSLGARHQDKGVLFEDGQVDFRKVQETRLFQDGISRLEKGIEKGYRIALMCSEKEALDCHRFGLISSFLSKNGMEILHIYPDRTISQKDLEDRLLERYRKQLPQPNLFEPNITRAEQLDKAYYLQNRDIGYNAFTNQGDEV